MLKSHKKKWFDNQFKQIFTIIVILLTITNVKYLYSKNIIKGSIYYSDNFAPVTNDFVYILSYDYNLCIPIYYDSVSIDVNGNYCLLTYLNDSVLICVGHRDQTVNEDHVTTYYLSTIDWQQAVNIYLPDNPTNINIAVNRITPSNNNGTSSGTITTLDSNNNPVPVSNAIVIAKQDSSFKSTAITDSTGSYTLDSLNNGSSIIYAVKIGYSMDSSNVIVGSNIVHRTNITLKKIKLIKTRFSNSNHFASQFKLYQNYPNPFNPSTDISYTLKDNCKVKLTIYDILGKEIITLVNEYQEAGYKTVHWDASYLSSGIYFYKLITGKFISTKKMLLIK